MPPSGVSASDIATSPITVLMTLGTVLSWFLNIHALNVLLLVSWSNLGAWFTLASLTNFAIVPYVDFIPAQPVLIVTLLLALAMLGKTAWKMVKEYETEIKLKP